MAMLEQHSTQTCSALGLASASALALGLSLDSGQTSA